MLSPMSTGRSTSGRGVSKASPYTEPDVNWARHFRPGCCESIAALCVRCVLCMVLMATALLKHRRTLCPIRTGHGTYDRDGARVLPQMLSPTSTGRSTSSSSGVRASPYAMPDTYWAWYLRLRRHDSATANAQPDEHWVKHFRPQRYKSIATCRVRRVLDTAPQTAKA